jgi:ATP-dependent exoDNAse (exonuclease V) beta subunit
VVRLLNGTLAEAFGPGRGHNFGLPPAEGAPAPFLQVTYEPLAPGPANAEGGAWLLPIVASPVEGTRRVGDRRLADEARQIARFLASGGPGSVGAPNWGDICVMAPRRAWLTIVRDEFEAAGLKTALQMRRNRNGDNPAYAWLCGLLSVACDPENTFEWVGVLREVFAVSDSAIAAALGKSGGLKWDEPECHAEPIRSALAVLRPFIERAETEGESLGRYAADLAAACGLAQMARLADPDGGLEAELARLLAHASELGAGGAGPRPLLRDLLESIDGFHASGRPAADAVNLITSHSAKGLEWPVVIPVGLWRAIKFRGPEGLRIVGERDGARRVVLDSEGVGRDARESREREQLRELVRLLYVTVTRPRSALVIPWSAGAAPEGNSFAELWGLDPGALDALPPAPRGEPQASTSEGVEPVSGGTAPVPGVPGPTPAAPAPAYPKRVLPHELARAPDMARAARHESSIDEPAPVSDGPDPLAYGVWWHETLECLPWEGEPAAVAAHGEASMAKAAEMGFEGRGREEWGRLLASEPWRLMRDPRWSRLAEVGVLAPLGEGAWIDGVIDLVLHDPSSREVWIVDWKTNRRGRGEDDPALLRRLASDYEAQLRAYGDCTSMLFPGCPVRLWVYSTAAGAWTQV